MARRSSQSTQQTPQLLRPLLAALTRACKAVEGKIDPGEADLPPGGLPVDITVRIAGDLVVGQGTPAGDPLDVPAAETEDLLALMISAVAVETLPDAMRGYVQVLKDADRGDTEAKARLEAGRVRLRDAIETACRSKRFVRAVARPARKGSVTGKPAVTISGSVGPASDLHVEVR